MALLYCNISLIVQDDMAFMKFKQIVVRYKKIGYNMNILRQTACMVVNPIMLDNFASLFNCTTVGKSSDDGSLLNLFQLVGAWLSLSVVRLTVVLFVLFLHFGSRLPSSPLFGLITVSSRKQAYIILTPLNPTFI